MKVQDRIAQLRAGMRRTIIIIAHLLVWVSAYSGAYLLRFDGRVPAAEMPAAIKGLVALLVIRVAAFYWSGLFHGLMRYAGIPELRSILRATTVASVLFLGVGVLIKPLMLPRSIYVGEWLLAVLAAGGLRLSVRIARESQGSTQGDASQKVLLVGAGDAGDMFLRDLQSRPNAKFNVVAAVDDDLAKQNGAIRGVKIVGGIDETTMRRTREDLGATLAILAVPSVAGQRTREIVEMCKAAGLETKTLPALHQIAAGDVKVSMLREVRIDDLLRRAPVELDQQSMIRLLKGRRVLITGGAGSIGRELARQTCRFEPAQLAILDHNENALFFLERELREDYPRTNVQTAVGDIKDAVRVSSVMRDVRPHVVLHAAAHKHVPLMEQHPGEAIKNNIFGTRVVADLSEAHGVEVFVLVSTDKAVNPTSVMGASKRVAEMYVQSLDADSRTRFVAVRFGNVLGSDGSVVQVFRQQIARGGPVTVTHPDMRRYFMTIPEACQLVLQAGALAEGGEVLLLDMGEPVKVLDLAHDMIRMSGLEPNVDINVEFSGPRPGEKLYEEMLLDGEQNARHIHPKIVIGNVRSVDREEMRGRLARLLDVVEGDAPAIRAAIAALVPEAKFARTSDAPNSVVQVLDALHEYSTVR